MGNIIGEPFEPYVNFQIRERQRIYGKKSNRTTEEIAYLNSTNGWIKLASGVSIDDDRLALLKVSQNQMLNGVSKGKQLAANNVLFNGLTSYNDNGTLTNYTGIGKGGKVAYGADGTDFGYSPMPGIIDLNVKDLNRGSIKKASLTIKVFNRNQLEVIDCLYMRLGYTVLLEWGHNQYWDDSQTPSKLVRQPPSLIDTHFFKSKYDKSDYTKFLPLIKNHRRKTRGNYDAMFGTVSNFSWTFEQDGSYSCKIEIISLGDIIESLGISISTNLSGINNKLQQSKIANSRFATRQAQDLGEFYLLYPNLQEDLKNFYEANVQTLNNPDYLITKNPDARYGGIGSVNLLNQLNGSINFSSTLSEATIEDPLQETAAAKQQNINNILGGSDRGSYSSNKALGVMGNYYVNQAISYFTKLEEDKQYVALKIELDPTSSLQKITSFSQPKENSTLKKYTYKYFDPKRPNVTITPVDQPAFPQGDNGYDSNFIFGELYLNAYLGTTDPDGDFTSRKPLGFGNLSVSTARGLNSTNDIIEDTSQGYVFRVLQKQILLKIISFESFEQYIFDTFKNANRAGGPDDPQFKTQTAQAEAEDSNPNEGEKQITQFQKIMEERSVRGNFFKYFYDIKNFYTPTAISSDQIKEDTPWYNTPLKDLVTFPSLKDRPPVLCLWDNPLESIIVGRVLNPIVEADKDIAKEWNSTVGYPKYEPRPASDGTVRYFPVDKKGNVISTSVADFIRLNITNIDKSFYIRFGTFLSYLRDINIPEIDSTGNPPLIDIDLEENFLICYAMDNQISSDPRKVIIANNKYYGGEGENKNLFDGIGDFVKHKDGYVYGNLLNVYLNCNRIEELLTELADKRSEVKLFDFLEAICDDINTCLGGVNNLEVTVNKDENKIRIIDQTTIPGLEYLFPEKFSAKSEPLEVFGYSNNKASFVHNIGFTTQISKEYATMITIGATSKGSVPGTEATAFSKWNVGIQDRFKNNLTSPDAATVSVSSSLEQLEEENKTVKENYSSNLLLDYQSLGFTDQDSGGEIYLTFNDEFIKNNQKINKEFYKYKQAYVSISDAPENKGITDTSIGFIPFNLKVDMEGMSGFKIYQRLKVNTEFLPSNYDKTLDFVVTGVNHTISNNQWTTNLETLATSKSVLAK